MVLTYAHGDGQELALLATEGSAVLDAVGASIWSALSEPATVEMVAAEVSARFRTTTEECSADVARLLDELAARGFATTSPAPLEPDPPSPAAVRALADVIPAAGTRRHGQLVYGLVRWLKPASVVETGTWCGHLTAVIAAALAENGRGSLVSVDDWSGIDVQAGSFLPRQEDVKENLDVLGLGDRVQLRRGSSTTISLPDRVDMAVLDSRHDAPHVQTELARLRAASCGCVLVHDVVSRSGPRSAIGGFLASQEPCWSAIEAQFDAGLALLVDPHSPLLAGDPAATCAD